MPQYEKNTTKASYKKHMEQLDTMFEASNENSKANGVLIILGICLIILFFLGVITLLFMSIS